MAMEARDGETEGEGGASTPLPHVFGVLSLGLLRQQPHAQVGASVEIPGRHGHIRNDSAG
jgi:hypothetical protein